MFPRSGSPTDRTARGARRRPGRDVGVLPGRLLPGRHLGRRAGRGPRPRPGRRDAGQGRRRGARADGEPPPAPARRPQLRVVLRGPAPRLADGRAHDPGAAGRGVGACTKHFAGNESEVRRHFMSSEVDERTLREVHLAAFEAAVVEAGTWSVMSSYNRLNGTYASDHRWLLTELLRDEWGFDGAVISDWGGTMSIGPAVVAGCDLEMPGPGSRAKHLEDAVSAVTWPRPTSPSRRRGSPVWLAARRRGRRPRRRARPGRRRLPGGGGRRPCCSRTTTTCCRSPRTPRRSR